ncbi:hypothetical protein ACIRQQ_02480 [Streptomyces fuscichromogenes]|uniref:hypothetical protein n=1 Tax=Streptomyces fuscichromogenes TaxID=1324013 RepID=UPI0038219CE8
MAVHISGYFDLFNFKDGPDSLQELKSLFAETSLFQYGGERVLGVDALLAYHQDLLSGWATSALAWNMTSHGEGGFTAEWSQTYTSAGGRPGSRSGTAAGRFAPDGSIAEFYTFLEHDSQDMGRVLLGRHLDVWWARDDADKRLELMKGVYADDVSFADPAASVRGHAELNSLISRTPVITNYRVVRYHVTFDHLLYRWDTNFADGTRFGGWEYLRFRGDLIDSVAVWTDAQYTGIS